MWIGVSDVVFYVSPTDAAFLVSIWDASWDALEARLGIVFSNKSLLITAMTHSSLTRQRSFQHETDNERLEFFGDSVVKLVISEYLMNKYPRAKEGELTKLRAWLVSDKCLSFFSTQLCLGVNLRLSFGEEKGGGRERISTLANAFEALMGAVFLDRGLSEARGLIERLLLRYWDVVQEDASSIDHKTQLQEWSQQQRIPLPEYHVMRTEGPDHSKVFFVNVMCRLAEGDQRFSGEGTSRKDAEQRAAKVALDSLRG
jgi:ribonuclease III